MRERGCKVRLKFKYGPDLGAEILTAVVAVVEAVAQPVVVAETRAPREVAIVLGRRPEIGTYSYLGATDQTISDINQFHTVLYTGHNTSCR